MPVRSGESDMTGDRWVPRSARVSASADAYDSSRHGATTALACPAQDFDARTTLYGETLGLRSANAAGPGRCFVARGCRRMRPGEDGGRQWGELLVADGEKSWPRVAAGGLSGWADCPVAVELEQVVRGGD